MLKQLARLTNSVIRRNKIAQKFVKTQKTLEEAMKFKKIKNPEKAEDQWEVKDNREIYKILKSRQDHPRYMKIQNNWKNNLIKKEKRRERRIEAQKIVEINSEEPKFIVHR